MNKYLVEYEIVEDGNVKEEWILGKTEHDAEEKLRTRMNDEYNLTVTKVKFLDKYVRGSFRNGIVKKNIYFVKGS